MRLRTILINVALAALVIGAEIFHSTSEMICIIALCSIVSYAVCLHDARWIEREAVETTLHKAQQEIKCALSRLREQ